eukprot:gnl/MRDRNA2_/MRDRNA2_72611_c0_seq1.p1 gnl/MRDRNA2_/MRDRNA2_72611_c0~~gnl/MRDRNA2_/MRDRNA2_72611_c0_seq1.p1  ORF type:complete len:288 (+),score=91.28 gnl/MRDRNA2_/MRDRNA2_72611_c0_seq1:96-959(+)
MWLSSCTVSKDDDDTDEDEEEAYDSEEDALELSDLLPQYAPEGAFHVLREAALARQKRWQSTHDRLQFCRTESEQHSEALRRAQQDVQDYEKEHREIRRNLRKARGDLEASTKARDSLEREIEDAQGRSATAEARLAAADQAVQEFSIESANLRQDIDRLRAEASELRKRNQIRDKELREKLHLAEKIAMNRLADRNAARAAGHIGEADLAREIEVERCAEESVAQQAAKAQRQLPKLRSKNDTLRQELRTAEEERHSLEKAADNIACELMRRGVAIDINSILEVQR